MFIKFKSGNKKPGNKKPAGFTIVELILTVALMVAIVLISVLSLGGRKGQTELDGITKQIVSQLREAQSKSVSQINGTTWGMRFDNATSSAYFGTYSSSTYATTTKISYTRLPRNIRYTTTTLPVGSYREITFSQLSGTPSTTTVVSLQLTDSPNVSTTITIGGGGVISY